MRDVYIDELYEVYLDDEGFVRMTRTAQRVEDLARLAETLEGLSAAIQSVTGPHKGRGILFDLRATPARNDDDFEATIARYRRLLYASFDRVAVLTRTQVGKLQLQRFAREDGMTFALFEDEAAALRHLRGEPEPGRP